MRVIIAHDSIVRIFGDIGKISGVFSGGILKHDLTVIGAIVNHMDWLCILNAIVEIPGPL